MRHTATSDLLICTDKPTAVRLLAQTLSAFGGTGLKAASQEDACVVLQARPPLLRPPGPSGKRAAGSPGTLRCNAQGRIAATWHRASPGHLLLCASTRPPAQRRGRSCRWRCPRRRGRGPALPEQAPDGARPALFPAPSGGPRTRAYPPLRAPGTARGHGHCPCRGRRAAADSRRHCGCAAAASPPGRGTGPLRGLAARSSGRLTWRPTARPTAEPAPAARRCDKTPRRLHPGSQHSLSRPPAGSTAPATVHGRGVARATQRRAAARASHAKARAVAARAHASAGSGACASGPPPPPAAASWPGGSASPQPPLAAAPLAAPSGPRHAAPPTEAAPPWRGRRCNGTGPFSGGSQPNRGH
mmetsp:Transcript_48435/g.154679  ORF Transcript_48435/g.154679 Transcript_48435/m.154679 type:complete len:358 (+) Transcript_48435:163-1236(+)